MTVTSKMPDDLFARISKFVPSGAKPLDYKTYIYHDENKNIIGAVARVDYISGDVKDKTFLQADYNKQYKKYKNKAETLKTSLYNRHIIKDAEIIIWCEGEKAASALQEILPEGYAATTNTGGSGNAHNLNATPLLDKKVIIWPDNDTAGKRGAIKLNNHLSNMKVKVSGWVDVKDDWDIKDDAFDVVNKYGKDYVINLFNSLATPRAEELTVPDALPENTLPFLVLGRSVEDDIFVYCFQDATIRSFSSSSFDDGMMIKIYNDMNFWRQFCGMRPRSDKCDAQRGFQQIWSEVLKKGIFRPEQTRYGGIYKEGNNFVAHLGDRLYENGDILDLNERMDHGIYVEDMAAHIETDESELSQEQASNLINYFTHFRTKEYEQREIMLGWAVASLLAPSLPRRPHLWFYAPANTGKSFITKRLHQMIEPFSTTLAASSTTYAGMKQYIQSRGCAVFWDESEAHSEGDSYKWSKVMDVVRISFDATDEKIVQGSREQVATMFVPRMMFCFSSIKMADLDEALSSRVIKIQLLRPSDKSDMMEYYKQANELQKIIEWEKLPDRLFKLIYNHADVYFDYLEKAKSAFMDQGVDDRRAYALAVCFAGVMLLRKRDGMSEEAVRAVIWKDAKRLMPEAQSESEYLKSLIFSASVKTKDRDNNFVMISFIDFCQAKIDKKYEIDNVRTEIVDRLFRAHGLMFNERKRGVFVWEKSPRLYHIMGKYNGISSVAPSLNGYVRVNSGRQDGFLFDISEDLLYNSK